MFHLLKTFKTDIVAVVENFRHTCSLGVTFKHPQQ